MLNKERRPPGATGGREREDVPMVRGFVQRRRFSGGDPDVLNGGGGHAESLLVFPYIVTARRRVGWVGDALPFCAALLLPARLFQSGNSCGVIPPQGVFLWPGLNSFFMSAVPWRRRAQPKSCLYSLGAFLPLRLCTFRCMPVLAGRSWKPICALLEPY